jgi:integrase/recombinase XerC
VQDIPDSVRQWLDELVRQGKSEHTIAAYRRAVCHFADWNRRIFGASFEPTDVIPRDVRDWKTYQRKVEKAAPSTINQRLSGLAGFFAWANRRGMVSQDPTSQVPTIQLPRRRPKALPAGVLRRLLRGVHKSQHVRDIAIIEVLVGTGIRVGELLDLQVGDVILRERSGLLIVRAGKHGSYREIPLTGEVRRVLAAYLDTHPHRDDPAAPLWLSSYGPLSQRSSVRYLLNQYARQAGIQKTLSPHMLRHTFATRYLAANPDDVRGLAALLGHASLDTVMIYTQPALEDLAARLERVETYGSTAHTPRLEREGG